MTIQELFVKSNTELKRVIDQISDDQWSMNMPAGITRNPSTLQEAVNYHAYDDAWVPDVLDGKINEEVGDIFEFLRTSTDTKADYAKYNALAISAVDPFSDLDKIVHLSYGDFSARDYLQHITIFRSLRSYDIAKMIGVDTTMDPDFVNALSEEYTPLADGFRAYGILPPAKQPSKDARPQTKFLALVGRD